MEVNYIFLKYLIQMIKLTRAHIGIAVLPSFWLGSLFALVIGANFDFVVFLLGFLIIFLIYASAAYINDYYDFEADKYNRQFGFSGGSGVLLNYPELRKFAKVSALGLIFLSIGLTIVLSWTTYVPFWAVGYICVGAFFSWFYSAPPIKLSYRGFSELPHFLAGLMNAGWGYVLLTGTIDFNLVIFSIPLALHLLNVILIFEIPDREADIHGGKQNMIVKFGRQTSFLLICILFWIASFYVFILAGFGWLSQYINFWIIGILSLIPAMFSTYTLFIKPIKQTIATKYAISNAIALFATSIVILSYFLIISF